MDYDVCIIGGGPAGSAAGLTLLKKAGLRVVLLEKSNYTTYRTGESLSPGVRSLLEYLDVWTAFDQQGICANCFGTKAAWGRAEMSELDFLFTIHGAGWSLDRKAFDLTLLQRFREKGGTALLDTSYRTADRLPDAGWSVNYLEADGRESNLTARYLIDATGRKSLLASQLGEVRTVYDRLVGVVRTGRLIDAASQPADLMIEAVPEGWWYTSRLPGGAVNTVFMTDADVAHDHGLKSIVSWEELMQKSKFTRERARGIRYDAPPRLFNSGSSILNQSGGTDWIAAGDAAAAHDPLSSSGIPNALSGGINAALVAVDQLYGKGTALPRYQAAVHENYRQYLRTRWDYYRRETRWPGAPFWNRRRTALQLPPGAVIAEVVSGDAALIHLSGRAASSLLRHCQPGLAAHEVVTKMKADYPQYPDERIILGLQEMVARGSVRMEGQLAGG